MLRIFRDVIVDITLKPAIHNRCNKNNYNLNNPSEQIEMWKTALRNVFLFWENKKRFGRSTAEILNLREEKEHDF